MATLPSAVDIVSICPRGLPQSTETTTVCHNMHLTQDPQFETTNRASYHQKPSSAAVRRRYGASRWFVARRTPHTRLTRRTRFLLESSTKQVRDSHACDNTPSAYNFTSTDKCSTIFNTITRHRHLSAVLGNDTETDDVSPEQTQITDHMNIKVIWARARIEIDMLDTYRSRSTENEHPFGSEVLVQAHRRSPCTRGK